MKLSPHFDLSEFTQSQTAARLGLDNTPPAGVVDALSYTASQLERIRTLLGAPLFISSGYRSLAVNRAVGGKDSSQHCKGEAADFTCPGFGDPRQIVAALVRTDVLFDQLILEHADAVNNGWVHISFSDHPRKQVLIIDRLGTRFYA